MSNKLRSRFLKRPLSHSYTLFSLRKMQSWAREGHLPCDGHEHLANQLEGRTPLEALNPLDPRHSIPQYRVRLRRPHSSGAGICRSADKNGELRVAGSTGAPPRHSLWEEGRCGEQEVHIPPVPASCVYMYTYKQSTEHPVMRGWACSSRMGL